MMASNANIAANKRKLAKQQAAAAKKIKDPAKKAAMIAKSKANAKASKAAATAARAEKISSPKSPSGYKVGTGKYQNHTPAYWASKGQYGKAKEAYDASGGTNWNGVMQHLKWRYDGKTFANTPFWKSYAESGGTASPPPKPTTTSTTKPTPTPAPTPAPTPTPNTQGKVYEPSFGLENWWADEQYDFTDYLNNVQGGDELNQWNPMGSEWTGGPNLIPKGKYGMKQGPSSYLENRGIGHNLAYKPWMPISWTGSPDADEPYRGVPGGKPMRDVLYHYGGRTPGQLPGGWQPQTPEDGPPVYPITRTPLFPTGKMSAAWKPPAGKPPSDEGKPPSDEGKPPSDGDLAKYGPLLANYAGMASATPEGLWRITGEPEKITLNPITGGTKNTYKLPVTFYGAGMNDPWKTHAIRSAGAGDWNPSFNQWQVQGSRDHFTPGPLSLANWTGQPGAYSGAANFSNQPGLNFLASPTYSEIQNQTVPFLASAFGGPVNSSTQGPLGSGAFTNWSLPGIHGGVEGEGDVVGYNFPRFYVDPGNDESQ